MSGLPGSGLLLKLPALAKELSWALHPLEHRFLYLRNGQAEPLHGTMAEEGQRESGRGDGGPQATPPECCDGVPQTGGG